MRELGRGSGAAAFQFSGRRASLNVDIVRRERERWQLLRSIVIYRLTTGRKGHAYIGVK